MSYAFGMYDSPSRLTRFSHNSRYKGALQLLELSPNDVLLDYGGGDGQLIALAMERNRGGRYIVFDPSNLAEAERKLGSFDNVTLVNGTSNLPDASFTGIACLEVLEHVPVTMVDSVVADLYRLLVPGGKLVVSVPIEIGPVSLLKNAVRFAAGTLHPGTTPRSVVLSAFGAIQSILRVDGHIGFDYRTIPGILTSMGFELDKRAFTPFGVLGAFTNSQVHYRFTRPRRNS